MVKYNLVETDETGALTAFIDGRVLTADNTHANWRKLVDGVRNFDGDEAALARLFDPAEAIQDYFNRVSERVSIAYGKVFFDGDEIHNGLTDHIVRFSSDNDDNAQALVNFLEKVMTNPNEHSREQLYDWLSRFDFAITESGNFLAYKGVNNASGDEKYPYRSVSSGRAMVDGKVYNGLIPNGIGAIVEMPRGDVQHDPAVGCHTGLHAGTWEYASSFSYGPVLLVEINPRDVVSVPTDCNWQKIRTCRYTVVEVIDNKLDQSYYGRGYDTVGDDVELDEDYSDDAPFEGSEDASYES